jgi:cysteine desulfurase/selenocysteine lyase
MILEVTKETATWNEIPYKFEAGTPNIAGVIGFGAAIKYLQEVGMEHIWNHEQELSKYGIEKLTSIPGIKILGAEATSLRGAIFAFDLPGVHPHDIGSILDEQGICIRAGHHCAMPLHKHFGLVATTRASGYFYTTKEEIDALVAGLRKVQELFI